MPAKFNVGDQFTINVPFDPNRGLSPDHGYGRGYENGTPVVAVGKGPKDDIQGPGGHVRVQAEGEDWVWANPCHLQPAE